VRFKGSETISGQLLTSDTTTPNRPDLHASWTGATLRSGAGQVSWNHSTEHFGANAVYKDFGSDFRVDNGFLPQVGYREQYVEPTWTFRPTGFLSRVGAFVSMDRQSERDNGAVIFDSITPGRLYGHEAQRVRPAPYDARTSGRASCSSDATSSSGTRNVNPSRRFQFFSVEGFLGQDVDFDNVRLGRGGRVNMNATINATDHLVFDLISNTTWLHVDDAASVNRPLFTSRVSRCAPTTFTARSFVRLIGQYVSTDRDVLLPRAANRARRPVQRVGAVCYKINWQSVMFFGYGDEDARRHAPLAEVRSPDLRQGLLRVPAVTTFVSRRSTSRRATGCCVRSAGPARCSRRRR
jgi:hypothetical protein